MGRIIELNQHVSNQIAAGEVVERPSSVVKELIENSLDAHAREIEVRIKNGGLDQLIISDDGYGMDEGDLALAIRRYATSKLKSISDLDTIASFGFRGEALPSIASVSRMVITSRTKEQTHALRAVIGDGRISELGRAGGKIGTRIEVANLFYNVPARLKFIKSPRASSAEIEGLIKAYAFSFPKVGFRFFCDDRMILSFAPAEGEISLERGIALLGKDVEGFLYTIGERTDAIGVIGVLSAPMVVRRDARSMALFVNNRPITDRRLVAAIRRAYSTLLEVGRSPACAIKIEIPSEEVDVNVHPRKSEVRFRDERKVFSHLIGVVGEFLAQTPWLRSERKDHFFATPTASAFERPPASYAKLLLKPLPASRDEVLWREPVQKKLMLSRTFSDLRVIGQLASTYILAESELGLVIIDQHAAHERVMFERIRERGKNSAQTVLLLPISLVLDRVEMIILSDHLEDLKALGFEMERFSEDSILVRAMPELLQGCDVHALIRDILSDLKNLGQAKSFHQLFEGLCATLACHSSIRAGQRLSVDEMNSLLKALDGITFAAHCPHGRPMVKSFERSELKRWFDRT